MRNSDFWRSLRSGHLMRRARMGVSYQHVYKCDGRMLENEMNARRSSAAHAPVVGKAVMRVALEDAVALSVMTEERVTLLSPWTAGVCSPAVPALTVVDQHRARLGGGLVDELRGVSLGDLIQHGAVRCLQWQRQQQQAAASQQEGARASERARPSRIVSTDRHAAHPSECSVPASVGTVRLPLVCEHAR